MGQKRIVFSSVLEGVSRVSERLSFQRAQVPPALSLVSRLKARHKGLRFCSPECSGPWATLRPYQTLHLSPGTRGGREGRGWQWDVGEGRTSSSESSSCISSSLSPNTRLTSPSVVGSSSTGLRTRTTSSEYTAACSTPPPLLLRCQSQSSGGGGGIHTRAAPRCVCVLRSVVPAVEVYILSIAEGTVPFMRWRQPHRSTRYGVKRHIQVLWTLQRGKCWDTGLSRSARQMCPQRTLSRHTHGQHSGRRGGMGGTLHLRHHLLVACTSRRRGRLRAHHVAHRHLHSPPPPPLQAPWASPASVCPPRTPRQPFASGGGRVLRRVRA